MFGEDPFARLFTPSPLKSSTGNSIESPLGELGVRSPLSFPSCFDASKTDQLSFAEILATYEEMEQRAASQPVKSAEQKKNIAPAVFRPFVSLESVEATVHRLAAMHSCEV